MAQFFSPRLNGTSSWLVLNILQNLNVFLVIRFSHLCPKVTHWTTRPRLIQQWWDLLLILQVITSPIEWGYNPGEAPIKHYKPPFMCTVGQLENGLLQYEHHLASHVLGAVKCHTWIIPKPWRISKDCDLQFHPKFWIQSQPVGKTVGSNCHSGDPCDHCGWSSLPFLVASPLPFHPSIAAQVAPLPVLRWRRSRGHSLTVLRCRIPCETRVSP